MQRRVSRIDLFTAPDCPACPRARAVVEAFARANPEVEVREWDLTRDPGPAAGRGIVATPALLVDGKRIWLGIPDASDLRKLVERTPDA